MELSRSINGRLARRMSLYVILVSTLIAIFTTTIQIYTDFQRDVRHVHAGLDQIEKTHLSNIASRVWVLDDNELEHTLKGLLSLPSIQYIAVYEDDNLFMEVGKNVGENVIVKHYPLIYKTNNINVGKLTVKASLDEVYQNIVDRALVILMTNAIKTFIVAGLILIIFHQLVARHLSKISKYAEQLNIDNLGRTFEFDRKKNNPEYQDELDLLNTALSNMQKNLAQAADSIIEREKDLIITLNSIGDAVITTDASGHITRMNPIAEQLTGWSLHDAKAHKIRDVFPIVNASTREPIESPIEKVISTGETVYLSNHTTLISRDGNEYQIADSAAPIRNSNNEILGMVLVFNDVTEQYHLREAAAKSKRDLQAIMDHSPAVIYVKDLEGRYLFINKEFSDVLQIDRNTAIGKNDFEIHPKNVAAKIRSNDAEVIKSGDALEFEEKVVQADGRCTYMSIKFPLLDEAGQIYALCGISTDITDRKQQEEKLRRSLKMDALGKLTGGIAHDYNNMLGIINGYAELLSTALSEQKQPELARYAEEIHHAGERNALLTRKLLDFSRHKNTETDTMNINMMLQNEQHMLEKILTARIKINFDLDENLWPVSVDSADMENAVINLSINAMHAIDDNGELTFQTRNEQVDEVEAGNLGLHKGDYIKFSVIDNGCGMDTSIKDKIFDPFYSTKGDRGTGLGLSQVYGFIERSNGAIKVYSEPGHGTQFVFYFPRHYIGMSVEENETDYKVVDLTGNETILVVDDEPALLGLSNEILMQQGYHVIVAESGKQALDILQNQHVDLVLSDVIMPQMDGYQLACIVQDKYPHIKIQMASGFSDDRDRDILDTSLQQNLIHKPFNSQILLKRIRSLLDSDELT